MGYNKNWSQIGDELEDMVRSALESKDFQKLNETIARTADDALVNVEKTVQKAMDAAHEKVRKAGGSDSRNANPNNGGYSQNTRNYQDGTNADRWEYRNQRDSIMKSTRFQPGYEKAREKQLPVLRDRYRNTSGQSSAGIVLSACGYSFLFILIMVLGIILGVTLGTNTGVAMITTGIMAPFIAGSAFMAYKGTALLTRTKRFRRYVETIRGREYCQIKELADSLGKTESFVKKDLNRMIKKRLFLHGHLDRQQTCLMVTDNAYEQYQTAEKQLELRQKEEQKKAEEAEKLGRRKDIPEEAKKVIAAGKEYLEEIKKCNDRIPGEEISEKISRLELVISKIFNRVEQHPELVDDLGRFMDYYLPTTVKLLKAYEDLDAQPVQGENIRKSKKEIEDTLDTIDKAFENLLDSFFEEAAWDISSDISVLHNMFAQEGLTENEFDKIKLER